MPLWACGSNAHGQLGIGTELDAHVPLQCKYRIASDADFVTPICLAGGANHSILVTSNGSVFSAGRNDNGQLGLADTANCLLFTQVDGVPHASAVSCGWDHTAVLTRTGEVWVFGSNKYGQLGVGAGTTYSSAPLRVPGVGAHVVALACGMRSTVAVTRSGDVWVWGSNRHAELVGNGMPVIHDPVHISGLDAVGVACGQYHTVYATRDGEVECRGRNRHGQLSGEDKEATASRLPLAAGVGDDISRGAGRQVFAGWSFSGFLDSGNGGVTLWGRSDHGQLAVAPGATLIAIITSPVRSPFLTHMQHIVCGSEHALGVTTDGSCFAWGWNEHGNCGVGHTEDVQVPCRVDLAGTVTVAGCGYGHSMMFTDPNRPI